MPQSIEIHALPYTGLQQAQTLFQHLADEQWPVWLDSGMHTETNQHANARYDILTANPAIKVTHKNGTTNIQSQDHIESQTGCPFDIIKRQLLQQQLEQTDTCTDLPFKGGAIGYFAYDLNHQLEKLPQHAVDDMQQDDMINAYFHIILLHIINMLLMICNKMI